jgi:hypothetical protein
MFIDPFPYRSECVGGSLGKLVRGRSGREGVLVSDGKTGLSSDKIGDGGVLFDISA